MRNYFNEYEDLDCSVFGISTDSPLVLAVWRKDLRLPLALLSDYNRGVCRDYQCLYDEFGGFKGVSRRAAYVIDREGTIRYSYVALIPAIFLILRRSSSASERSNDAPVKKLSSRAR